MLFITIAALALAAFTLFGFPDKIAARKVYRPRPSWPALFTPEWSRAGDRLWHGSFTGRVTQVWFPETPRDTLDEVATEWNSISARPSDLALDLNLPLYVRDSGDGVRVVDTWQHMLERLADSIEAQHEDQPKD